MAAYIALNSFNAGELSPKMLARCDVSQYRKGCRKLQNFLVTPYGSVESRPGTKFITSLDAPCRLVRFAVSSTIAYVAVFSDKKLNFIYNGAPLLQLPIDTPYALEQLQQLKFVQSADVMTIVHPDHPVYELKRLTENSFSLSPKEFAYPPVLDPNLDDSCTITPSDRSGSITLNASKDIFTEDNTGGFFQLIHVRKNNEISCDFTSDGVTDSMEVKGYWTFVSHGTWTGVLTIQRSFDNGSSWEDYQVFSSAKDSNISTSGEETRDNVLFRITMSDYAQSDSGTLKLCRILLTNPDFHITGVVKITAVQSGRIATGIVTKKLGDTEPTAEWNEGAWSVRRGFPRAVAFFEERMVFGGTISRPQTVWASKTNNWDDFLTGDNDDSAIEFTLASDTINTICWMVQHDALIIGTVDSEWTLSASDSGALTPSNFRVKRQSVYGSADITANMIGSAVLFVQRQGRKVREFAYSLEKDGYVSPDMTILADHITASGIKETALQQLPDSIYWCLLNDGTIAALTYERDQEVIGWHRHTTAGRIISICVIPNGSEDLLYWAVQRNGICTIEEMLPRSEKFFNVDSGVRVTAAPGEKISSITNLWHLEGQNVCVLGDRARQQNKTVLYGAVILDEEAENAVVGLPYTPLLETMPIELDLQNGSTMLRKKQISEVRIRFYDSVGGVISVGDNSETIISRDVLYDNMDSAVTLKNDVFSIHPLGGFSDTATVSVVQDQPMPMAVAALLLKVEVTE